MTDRALTAEEALRREYNAAVANGHILKAGRIARRMRVLRAATLDAARPTLDDPSRVWRLLPDEKGEGGETWMQAYADLSAICSAEHNAARPTLDVEVLREAMYRLAARHPGTGLAMLGAEDIAAEYDRILREKER